MNRILIALVISLISTSSFGVVITHGSSGGTFTVNNGSTTAYNASNFDRAEFTFASEYADTLTLANFGSGISHSHGVIVNSEIDVYDGTNWVNIFSSPAPAGSGIALSTLFSSPPTIKLFKSLFILLFPVEIIV